MPPATLPRIRPRHACIWVLVDGMWWSGWVSVMVRQGDHWLIWCQHDWPPAEPWVRWAWYRYSADTIRLRDGNPPPNVPES